MVMSYQIVYRTKPVFFLQKIRLVPILLKNCFIPKDFPDMDSLFIRQSGCSTGLKICTRVLFLVLEFQTYTLNYHYTSMLVK